MRSARISARLERAIRRAYLKQDAIKTAHAMCRAPRESRKCLVRTRANDRERACDLARFASVLSHHVKTAASSLPAEAHSVIKRAELFDKRKPLCLKLLRPPVDFDNIGKLHPLTR